MRKTKNLPWMGHTLATAIMVLVGLGVFAGSAAAQGSDLQNYMGWWDSLNCRYMVGAVNAASTDGLGGADFTTPHVMAGEEDVSNDGTDGNTDGERQWCHMWDGLGKPEQDALKAVATRDVGGITRKPTDELISAPGWWAALNQEAKQVAIGEDDGGTEFPDALRSLTTAQEGRVRAAYAALMSSGMMTETTDAPALPLVGIGFLGLLLAGRGAWLRRRA